MYQSTRAAVLCGLTTIALEIECSIGNGLPAFNIVGASTAAETAARERIRSALRSVGSPLPPSRVTVNIRPLDPSITTLSNCNLSVLDLPITLLILACQKMIPSGVLSDHVFLGELSLSGHLKSLFGALSLSDAIASLTPPVKGLFLPAENAPEGALCSKVPVYAVDDLSSILRIVTKQQIALPEQPPLSCIDLSANGSIERQIGLTDSIFDRIYGQESGKRGIVIAASGMHNLLMIGPPGCGKTLLARSVLSLLPPLDYEQQLELTKIYSASGLLPPGKSLIQEPPFRNPHHTITPQALLGGGANPRPGEATLAEHGVLFLDELAEMQRQTLEALREPLEEHVVRISRVQGSISYPADFLLIGAMNPCPCGHYPDHERCRCTASRLQQYYQKIDSPFLERIDLVLKLNAVEPSDMEKPSELSRSQASSMIRKARLAQQKRFQSEHRYNSSMNLSELEEFCSLSPSLSSFMKEAVENLHLSMRTYHRTLKVARTIADLSGSDSIELEHLSEALQYRLNIKRP